MNSKSVVTSVRLKVELNEQLERAAKNLKHGKNWLIAQAIEEYLNKSFPPKLLKEARKQSLRAKKQDNKINERLWQDNADHSGWV